MRFRKNWILMGGGEISSMRVEEGKAKFYVAGEGVIVEKSYDLEKHAMGGGGIKGYSRGYLRLKNGSVQDLGELVYIKDN